MTTYVLSADGHTVLVYRDGELVDEEPTECHHHTTLPPRDLTPCLCGIARVDCEYHR